MEVLFLSNNQLSGEWGTENGFCKIVLDYARSPLQFPVPIVSPQD